ncbi:MAG: OmpA family protein [Bacteroidales bacterium]|nr:OmpA family protein [Bacteroidales bacterium]
MKRFLLSVLMVMLAVYVADAQNKKNQEEVNICTAGHYLVFDVGGGLHTLAYNVDGYGSKNLGAGLMVRGGYRYFFTENWGVGTELNFKTFQTTFNANYKQTITDAVDEEGEQYEHRTSFNSLKEKQTQTVLSLPLAVYFQQRVNKSWKVGGGIGAIAQMELTNKYKTKSGDLETRGYYDRFNVELFGMEPHHFFTKSDFSGDNEKRTTMGALLEGNALYRITERLSLDLGIYLTFGFGYKNDDDTQLLFDPDCKDGGNYNDKYNGALGSLVVDRALPIAIGGMAGIRYQFGKIKKKVVPEKPIEKPVDVPDTNVVVDVPVKDTVPEVVVTDIPEQPVVPEVVDVPKKDTVPAVVVTEPEKKNEDVQVVVKRYTRVNVNFGLNESFIKSRPDLARMLDEIAEVMKDYPNTKLSVTGHTCNIGSLEQNMKLGQRRAEAFKAELVKRGVDGSRITCDSKAYLEPLFPNTTEANREKNRRVEFTMTE